MRDPQKAKELRNKLKSYIDSIKKTGKCSRCGNTDYRVLEFHHRKPEDKKFSIVQSVHNRYSLSSLIKEIAKCELLCSNCHRIEHFGDDKN